MANEDESQSKRSLADAPKPVVRRYWRLKSRRWGKEFGRAIVRQKLVWSERHRTRILKETFDVFKQYTIKTEHGRLQTTHMLYKMGLYLLIASRDVQAAKRDALTHPDEWTRRLHARVILLTVIEWDMDGLTGKALKRAYETLSIAPDVQQEMTAALRALRKIRDGITKDYSEIRNIAIAHRDPDVLRQYRAIRDLDTDKVYALVGDFFRAVEQFMAAHAKILTASSNIQSVLRQWSDWEKSRSGSRGR